MRIVLAQLLLTLWFCACLVACSSDDTNDADAIGAAGSAIGAAGVAGGAAGVASGAAGVASGTAGSADETDAAATKGPIAQRCDGDGSTVAIVGDAYIALSGEIPTFLEQYSGQTYRDYSEGGTLIEDVRQQAQKAYAEGQTETLIMNGGGNNAILNTNCLIGGLSDETCKSDVEKALAVLPLMFDEAEKAGVKEIIFFYYPHIVYMPEFMNALDDFALPVAQQACESRTDIDCTFIDTRDDFGGDDSGQYLIMDGINPNTEGSEIIAKLVWEVMQNNCANGLKIGGKTTVAPEAGTGGQTDGAGQGGQTEAGIGGVDGSSGAGGEAGSAGAAEAGTSGAAGTGSSGTGGAGGTIGTIDPTCLSSLKDTCKTGSTDPCSAFIVPTATALDRQVQDGTTLELGPYGAIMEPNMGKGFEVSRYMNDNDSMCLAFGNTFGEPAALNADLMDSSGVDLTLHTVYRPACMKDGEKYPILIWGNGTCSKPEGYGGLLRYIASYGFFVFAANSRYVGFGNNAMSHSLEYAFAANEDSSSPYYQRLDTTKVGAMGHSQGCTATVTTAAGEDRIKAVILFNMNSSASKTFLAMSGDNDISGQRVTQMASALASSSVPGAWMFFHKVPRTGTYSGHLTLMRQPERVGPAAVGWWQYILNGDAAARDLFVGDNCGLCGQDSEFEYDQKGLQ